MLDSDVCVSSNNHYLSYRTSKYGYSLAILFKLSVYVPTSIVTDLRDNTTFWVIHNMAALDMDNSNEVWGKNRRLCKP